MTSPDPKAVGEHDLPWTLHEHPEFQEALRKLQPAPSEPMARLCTLQFAAEMIRLVRLLAGDQARAEAAERERDEYGRALTSCVGGGSEMFAGKRPDGTYRVDVPFCVDRLNDRARRAHETAGRAVAARRIAENELKKARERLAKPESRS